MTQYRRTAMVSIKSLNRLVEALTESKISFEVVFDQDGDMVEVDCLYGISDAKLGIVHGPVDLPDSILWMWSNPYRQS